MKKSELVKMIREEVASLLREKKTKKGLTELVPATAAKDDTAVAGLRIKMAGLETQIANLEKQKATLSTQIDSLEKK